MGAEETFAGFLAALESQEQAAKLRPKGTPVKEGSMNHMKALGVCRHYDSMSEELVNLAERLKHEPEMTRKLLVDSGSWRYWVKQLELEQLRGDRAQRKGRLVKSMTETALSKIDIEPG